MCEMDFTFPCASHLYGGQQGQMLFDGSKHSHEKKSDAYEIMPT